MEPRTLQYLARACGGNLPPFASEILATGISTDSRRTRPGDLFVALAGETFDGHDFIEPALKAGARALLLDASRQKEAEGSCPVITVPNTRPALGLIAAAYRADFIPAVIAVGGSNGKTTTKELVASILATRWPVVWSEASFNNDIGVPLTLLRIERHHQAAVLEVGTNRPGELAPLLRAIRPRFGIITNIGREHLEFFKNLEGVAQEEGSMAEVLSQNGVLFLHGDSPWADSIASRARARIVRVGLGPRNDWQASALRLTAKGMEFAVQAPTQAWGGQYHVPLLGKHQVLNALFALAVAGENHFTRNEMQAGLAACPTPKMRLQLKWTDRVGWLNDAYNSNPDSMGPAFETLSNLPCAGQRYAVIGDMLELGPFTEAAHIEAGQTAAATGIDGLWTVGRWAESTARAAREAGLVRVTECRDAQETAAALDDALKPGDIVLLKASRGTRLETVEEFWTKLRGRQLSAPAK